LSKVNKISSTTYELLVNYGQDKIEFIVYHSLRKITIAHSCKMTQEVFNKINTGLMELNSKTSEYSLKLVNTSNNQCY
jgi:hypothetical protein